MKAQPKSNKKHVFAVIPLIPAHLFHISFEGANGNLIDVSIVHTTVEKALKCVSSMYNVKTVKTIQNAGRTYLPGIM
jgi:hypothetical protein